MMDIYEHTETQLVLVAEVSGGRLVWSLSFEASIRPLVEDCHSEQVGYPEGWFVELELWCGGTGRACSEAENWAIAHGSTEMASTRN